MSYIRPDPLTLSVIQKVDNSDRQKIINVVRTVVNRVSERHPCTGDCAKFLNGVADGLVESINRGWEDYFRHILWGEKVTDEMYFVLIPADTRFPGFVNSLGDHMLTTSAFAVSAALSYFDLRCGPTEAYNIKFDRELLRGFVRVAALLHDLGKPPVIKHAVHTAELISEIFSQIPPEMRDALSQASSHHHYGHTYDESMRPKNFVEWIIAFADKASASSRSFIIREAKERFISFVRDAMEIQKMYDLGGQDYLEEWRVALEGKSTYEESEDDEARRSYGFLSQDEERAIGLADRLIKAEEQLCNGKELLSLLHFEVPSIKSYLRRGRELSVYTGYSVMIDALIHRVSDAVRNRIGGEAVISDEGGSMLAIVPSTMGIDGNQSTESSILDLGELLKEFPFDSIRIGRMNFAFAEAHLGPRENWRGWKGRDPYVRDSLRGFGTLLTRFFGDPAYHTTILRDQGTITTSRLCSTCRINPVPEDQDREECYLCSRARDYYEAFRNVIRGRANSTGLEDEVSRLRIARIVEDLRDRLKDMTRERGFRDCVLNSIDDLSGGLCGESREREERSLEERRFPALIVGDGDNFGSLKANTSTLTQYMEVTRRFTYMIYYSILYALEKVAMSNSSSGLNAIEYFPILLGGDDFSLLLPAQNILHFSCFLDEALRKINGRVERNSSARPANYYDLLTWKRPYAWFGISGGAYIYDDTAYPLFLARESAERLEHMSKEVSKTYFQNRYFGSGFILTILDEKYINAGIRGRGCTILGEEAKMVWNHVNRLEQIGLNYRKLINYVKARGDTLKIYYDVSRSDGDRLKEVFSVLTEANDTGLNIRNYLILLNIMTRVLENRIPGYRGQGQDGKHEGRFYSMKGMEECGKND